VRSLLRAGGALALAGTGAFLYAWRYEAHAFTLRRQEVPILAPGAAPMRVLHLSDLHMLPGQLDKQRWIRDLGRLLPDLVLLTGDVLSHPEAGAPTLEALEPLFGVPGAFVPGNNDYWAPQWKNPLRYLTGVDKAEHKAPLDWAGFAKQLSSAGWQDLTNARAALSVGGRSIDLRGIDDPYSQRDDLDAVAGPADPAAVVRLGLAHAPEPRVLDAFHADGVDLTLCGHTHGGQVRVPGFGALVTNCGIDRGRARGLSSWPPDPAGAEPSWLHVSPGLGTSPYAPIRFACRPEATVLHLVGREEAR
jgi:predicted MPP superfamily phosphohydrolase